MDVFFTTLTLSFSPQILFAMIGGGIGAFISSDRARYGWQLSFMFMLVALLFAAAMGEYLYTSRGISSIYWLSILNVPLGMMVGSTLDVLRIANRPLIERLVNGIGDSGVSIIVESVLGKLRKWFGVDASIHIPDEDDSISKRNIMKDEDEDSYKGL